MTRAVFTTNSEVIPRLLLEGESKFRFHFHYARKRFAYTLTTIVIKDESGLGYTNRIENIAIILQMLLVFMQR